MTVHFSGEVNLPAKSTSKPVRTITVYLTKFWESHGIRARTAILETRDGITYARQIWLGNDRFYCRMGTDAHSTRKAANVYVVAQAPSRVDSLRQRVRRIEMEWLS